MARRRPALSLSSPVGEATRAPVVGGGAGMRGGWGDPSWRLQGREMEGPQQNIWEALTLPHVVSH